MRTECRLHPLHGWCMPCPSRGWLRLPPGVLHPQPAPTELPWLPSFSHPVREPRVGPASTVQPNQPGEQRVLGAELQPGMGSGGGREEGEWEEAKSLHHGPPCCTCPLGQKLPVSPCLQCIGALDLCRKDNIWSLQHYCFPACCTTRFLCIPTFFRFFRDF